MQQNSYLIPTVISLIVFYAISNSFANDSCTSGMRCPAPTYYCPGSPTTGAVCRNEQCRCLNNPLRDNCTCLSIIEGCHIQSNGNESAATASYNGSIQASYYSCVANNNCDNEVHVLGSYKSTPTGYSNVYLNRIHSSSRSIILVLSSYESTQWMLHVPNGVVISQVIISSFLSSSVKYPSGRVLAVENTLQLHTYGQDSISGGGDTRELLTNIYDRFGPVTSFTGSYQVDAWNLNITGQQPVSNCLSYPFPALPTIPPVTVRTEPPTDDLRRVGIAIGVGLGLPLFIITIVPVLVIIVLCVKDPSCTPDESRHQSSQAPTSSTDNHHRSQSAVPNANDNAGETLVGKGPPSYTAVITDDEDRYHSVTSANPPPYSGGDSSV